MDKCCFFAKQVEYLGHLIDEHGLHPTPTKVKAILEAPATPHNVFELRSFLGLLNYYGNSYLICLMNYLISTPWKWGPEQEKSFKRANDLLNSPRLLVHMIPSRSYY